jgi:hypothetical protein
MSISPLDGLRGYEQRHSFSIIHHTGAGNLVNPAY